jgi:cell division protein FtsZ
MTFKDINREIKNESDLGPKIVVIGVGGAGGNAVNNMIRSNLEGVAFVVANTDAQALKQSLVPIEQQIQLGLTITQGLGAGSRPDIGKSAAEESSEEVLKFIQGANMVFITAGMGGGTGTGAAPVIAKIAREAGILTVGVVTKPFSFEGSHRTKAANLGIEELQQYVDTLLVIPNQNLFRLANENTTFADAFKMADNVLYSGVRGVTDLMIMPGLINLDFADIRAVMSEMGKAMMGTGESEGDRRALDAAEAAISNPLLDDVSLQGARGILINITGGYDITLYEVDEAANRIRDEVDSEANIIFGSTFDDRLNGKVRVSVVATGIGGVQDAIFKNRDVVGVLGLNRHESNAKIFEQVALKNSDQNDEKVQLNNVINNISEKESSITANLSSTEEYSERSKRKAGSFFNRFTSKNKNLDPTREANYLDMEVGKSAFNENNEEKADFSDDLEIPSCFRKKK